MTILDIKNTPNSTDPKKKSGSKWITLGTAAMLTAGVFSTNLNYSQQPDSNVWRGNLKEKNRLELVEKNDTIDHEKIIHMDTEDILIKYWEEKWLKLINTHFTIEINNLRQELNITKIHTSNEIAISAQKQAEILDKLWYLDHMSWKKSLPRRLENDWIVFLTCWENLADWASTIIQLINDRLISTTHTANLTNKNFKKVGLGYKNKKWVYIAVW